jgi:hypothetical protein
MRVVRRALQVSVLVGLGIFAVQPSLLAFSCDDFMDLAWRESADNCGGGARSMECSCSEDSNGNLVDGICMTICLSN